MINTLIKIKILIMLTIFTSSSIADGFIVDDMAVMQGEPEGKYCANSVSQWCLVTDQVMGGISQGKLEILDADVGFFLQLSGQVSTDNNGGFIQIRTRIEGHPEKKNFKGVRIRVSGNGEEYAVHIRTKYLFLPWQYYSANFVANEDWQFVDLDFSEFSRSNFYQPSRFSSQDIETIGIVAIGRNFDANVNLSLVEFY